MIKRACQRPATIRPAHDRRNDNKSCRLLSSWHQPLLLPSWHRTFMTEEMITKIVDYLINNKRFKISSRHRVGSLFYLIILIYIADYPYLL